MSPFWFLWPWWSPLLLALPPVLALVCWRSERVEATRLREDGARSAATTGVRHRPLLRRLLDAAALLLVGAALLQPAMPGDEGEGGADVVLCVDASWSMACRDEAPSRLGAVQAAVDELAAALDRSRLGLVVFAGDAELRAPLTADGAAVAAMVRDLVAGTHGRGGSDPGAAILRALALLERGGRPGSIVLLGDGEDFVGNGAAAAARAAAAGHAVHAFGVGDPAGSKIPVEVDGREAFLRDGDGAEVVSRLEPGNLQAIAAAGGGRFARLGPGALRALHDGELLPAARAWALRAGRVAAVHLPAVPLLGAVLLWLLRACLGEWRR